MASPERGAGLPEGAVEQAAGGQPREVHYLASLSEQNSDRTPAQVELYGQVRDALEVAIATGGRSIDELLRSYQVAKDAKDYKGQSNAEEGLRQYVDQAALHGTEPDQRIVELFKKEYRGGTYSEATRKTLAKGIDVTDLASVATLLRDRRMLSSFDILARIKGDEQFEKLAALLDYDPKVTGDVAGRIENLDARVAVLEKALQVARGLPEEGRKRDSALFSLSSVQRSVAEKLAETKQFDALLDLIDRDVLDVHALDYYSLQDVPQEVVAKLVARGSTVSDVARAAKFVNDPAAVAAFAAATEQFIKLTQEDRGTAAELLRRYSAALGREADIVPVGRLESSNKFVLGLQGNGKMAIGWSTTRTHEYHKDIVRSVGRLQMVSGGAIALERPEGKPLRVVFQGRSGDFGEYNWTVLERFRGQLVEVLKRELKVDAIEVEIRKSGYTRDY